MVTTMNSFSHIPILLYGMIARTEFKLAFVQFCDPYVCF